MTEYSDEAVAAVREALQRTTALVTAKQLCRHCGGRMLPGIATDQTYVGGTPDFPGDAHASTFSAGGPGKVIECRKCENCGWSVT